MILTVCCRCHPASQRSHSTHSHDSTSQHHLHGRKISEYQCCVSMLSYPTGCLHQQHLPCSKISTAWFGCFGTACAPEDPSPLANYTFRLCSVGYDACLLQRHKYFENWGQERSLKEKGKYQSEQKKKINQVLDHKTGYNLTADGYIVRPRPALFPKDIRKFLCV